MSEKEGTMPYKIEDMLAVALNPHFDLSVLPIEVYDTKLQSLPREDVEALRNLTGLTTEQRTTLFTIATLCIALEESKNSCRVLLNLASTETTLTD